MTVIKKYLMISRKIGLMRKVKKVKMLKKSRSSKKKAKTKKMKSINSEIFKSLIALNFEASYSEIGRAHV